MTAHMSLVIELERTEDILSYLGAHKTKGQLICGFSMETQNMLENSKAKLAKKNLDCKGLRYGPTIKDRVKKVAVSSGAGGSNVFDAALAGVDVLVTGEIKHHEIIAANSLGIDIIDAGHFKSEDIVILPLVNKLSKEFSEIIFNKIAIL